MVRSRVLAAVALVAATLGGCGPSYSPDTYSAGAVQQANKVEQGIVVGVRKVDVSAQGVVGAVTGGAAGGLVGSQMGGGGIGQAFGALGGSVIGGLVGTAAEHTTADTSAFEYVVRKGNNEMVSVTQKDPVPLTVGQKVLVIAGSQARIVPDYTVPVDEPAPPKTKEADTAAPAVPPAVTATPLAPPASAPPAASAPVAGTPTPLGLAPTSAAPAGAAVAP